MKWLALTLLAINGFVWFAGYVWVPDRMNSVVIAQSLPRVSALKVGAEPKADAGHLVNDEDDEAGKLKGDPDGEPGVKPGSNSAPGSEPGVVTEQICLRLGWFETAEKALQTYRALGSPGGRHEVSEEERALEPLHWVIIPPQPQKKALKLFNELQRRGIDSYLVTRGENSNAISLGLFQSKEAAERVLQRKKRQNLNAVLANFPRNQLSYALVFEASPTGNGEAGDGWVGDFQDDFEMVEISRCEGVATTPENP